MEELQRGHRARHQAQLPPAAPAQPPLPAQSLGALRGGRPLKVLHGVRSVPVPRPARLPSGEGCQAGESGVESGRRHPRKAAGLSAIHEAARSLPPGHQARKHSLRFRDWRHAPDRLRAEQDEEVQEGRNGPVDTHWHSVLSGSRVLLAGLRRVCGHVGGRSAALRDADWQSAFRLQLTRRRHQRDQEQADQLRRTAGFGSCKETAHGHAAAGGQLETVTRGSHEGSFLPQKLLKHIQSKIPFSWFFNFLLKFIRFLNFYSDQVKFSSTKLQG